MPIFPENMNPSVAHKLLKVGDAFRIPGPFFSYEEIKMGNVNHTYKVNYIRDDGSGTVSYTHLTGSFGSTVLKHFLDSDLKEIRIFSRDEKKQDDMRISLRSESRKCFRTVEPKEPVRCV